MSTHRVAVLVRDGVRPFELGLAHQLFGHATRSAYSYEPPPYTVMTCAVTPGPVRTDADFPIHAPHGPEVIATADTVIVPAAHEHDEFLSPLALPRSLADALALARPDTRIASICTGAFVLAAAGLLDGKRATTHWLSTARFARTFPSVTVDPDVLYVDEGRVLTSAGEAAGIDLCLHMIRADHGAAVAADIARRTVVPPHREGGQAPYIRGPVTAMDNRSTAPARAWALEHIAEPITLADMAARAAMSVRTFSRRFRDETGLTPGQWLIRSRVNEARVLLEETDHTVDRVASEAGLGTGASLRLHFQEVLGVPPATYRTTFRTTESSRGA
ncbi:GlxA family transcriptional regulator [Streptomyces sp. NPDC091292]|uniref:GlxA family transcriptional regulator n=1 Tax=Streptomyces sp. NPDC091292 TaxID=3365991 RepID=UPI00381BC2E2